jgi:hypothetical protein
LPRPNKEGELRCFCRKKPLLGKYGRDARGNLYVHIKVYKHDRVFGEVVVEGGAVRIRCRECSRWFKVVIRQPRRVDMHYEALPEDIDLDHPAVVRQP